MLMDPSRIASGDVNGVLSPCQNDEPCSQRIKPMLTELVGECVRFRASSRICLKRMDA